LLACRVTQAQRGAAVFLLGLLSPRDQNVLALAALGSPAENVLI